MPRSCAATNDLTLKVFGGRGVKGCEPKNCEGERKPGAWWPRPVKWYTEAVGVIHDDHAESGSDSGNAFLRVGVESLTIDR